MKTFSLSDPERLESRLAPAGLVAVAVNAGTLTLGTVPGHDGDEVLTVALQTDGSYLLTPQPGVGLRIGGVDYFAPQYVYGVTSGLTAQLGSGNDRLTLSGGSLSGSATIDLGNGNNSLTVQDWVVGGGLTVTAGAGTDTVTFGGTTVAVGGTFSAALGSGTNVIQTDLNRASFGAIRVLGGTGNDTLSITQHNLDFAVGAGGLTFTGGGGFADDAVTLGDGTGQVSVAGPVRISGTQATTTVAIGGSRFDAGSLSLAFGGGDSSLADTAERFHLAGGLTWASGAGADTLNLAGTDVRIGGAVAVAAGSGKADIQLHPSALLTVGRGLTMSDGTESDGSNLWVQSTFGDVVIGGPVALTAGASDTSIDLLGYNLTVGGPVRLAHGAGPGMVRVASNGTMLIAGSVTATRPDGLGLSDVIGLGGGSIRGSVVMAGGGSQELLFPGVITGNVTMIGGAGTATAVTLSNNLAARPLHVGGTVRLISRSAAGPGSNIIVRGILVDRPATVAGGAGDDVLAIDDSTFQSSFAASLGAGADQFNLEQTGLLGGSTFAGAVTLSGGAGADLFQIGGNLLANIIHFRNAVVFDGGTGIDTKTVGPAVGFDPSHPPVDMNFP